MSRWWPSSARVSGARGGSSGPGCGRTCRAPTAPSWKLRAASARWVGAVAHAHAARSMPVGGWRTGLSLRPRRSLSPQGSRAKGPCRSLFGQPIALPSLVNRLHQKSCSMEGPGLWGQHDRRVASGSMLTQLKPGMQHGMCL